MKETKELRELIPELIEELEAVKKDPVKLVFTDRAKAIVKEVAEYARGTELWQFNEEQRKQFWEDSKDATPENIYGYMLDRVVNAPTRFHMNASVLLIIPRLDELINGEENEA